MNFFLKEFVIDQQIIISMNKLNVFYNKKLENNDTGETLKSLEESIIKYENSRKNLLENLKDNLADWYFFNFLKSLGCDKSYTYKLNEDEQVAVEIKLFEPFEDVAEEKHLINPQWHLLVAHYGYLDAAFNHPDNEYANKITLTNGWSEASKNKNNIRNKAIIKWVEEQSKSGNESVK